MLRFDYMASDFHPVFLFLGDAEDLTALAKLLNDFAQTARRMSVSESIQGSRSAAALNLVPAGTSFGLHKTADGFEWRLNAWQAGQIAERIALLTPDDNKSGSEIFEVGSGGEIPVKVSRGEFTDDFLVTKL